MTAQASVREFTTTTDDATGIAERGFYYAGMLAVAPSLQDPRAPVVNEVTAPVSTSGIYFDLRVDYRQRRIAVHGGVDAACSPNVATAVTRLQGSASGDITIDLGGVTFIDMSGLGVLVGARSTQTERGNRLFVTGASPQIHRIFGLGALAGLLDPDGATA